jgi:hypothetical protein
MVQHVNDTTIALSQRMDEGNQALATAVEERLGFVRTMLESVGPEVQRQLAEQTTTLLQRVDFTEHKVTDRMLAMEERVNEQNGTKIAQLDATIGRVGAGFDDAIAALSQRMLELENRLYDASDQLAALTQRISTVDDKAMTEMKEQLSAAIGEAMLVRIEVDRIVSTTEEKIGKNSLRMAEIEALLVDELDVSASVQLERLEELERALVALDPDQFVRKTDMNAGSAATRPSTTSTPTLTPRQHQRDSNDCCGAGTRLAQHIAHPHAAQRQLDQFHGTEPVVVLTAGSQTTQRRETGRWHSSKVRKKHLRRPKASPPRSA